MKRWGDVIEAFEEAGLNARDAYWGFDHRPTDGDKELVIEVGGREYNVRAVKIDGDAIRVSVERR